MSFLKGYPKVGKPTTAIKLSLGALALSMSMLSHADTFEAGKDYRVIENAKKIDTNRVIVREFFWYGCGHCYHLHPHAMKWKETKAKDVAFFETPAPFNAKWEQSSRGFYAAQALGVRKEAHDALFKAIQEENQDLFDQNSLGTFYARYGVKKNQFNKLFNSFAVGTKIGKARQAAKAYKLTGVPAIVVQGKYVVSGADEKTFKVVDYLINKVRKEDLAKE